MEIYKIAIVGIMATILIITLKEQSPVYAVLLSAATGIIILLYTVPKITEIIKQLGDMINATEISKEYFEILFKIIGISYITVFSSGICKDFGQQSLSNKIQLCGKVLIIFYSLPIITNLMINIFSIF